MLRQIPGTGLYVFTSTSLCPLGIHRQAHNENDDTGNHYAANQRQEKTGREFFFIIQDFFLISMIAVEKSF